MTAPGPEQRTGARSGRGRGGRPAIPRWAVLGASLLAAAVLPWADAASAQAAAYDPVGSGTTSITLSPSFLRDLRSHGVRLSATAPATLKGASVGFPVVKGRLDPVDAIGTAETEGALVFSAGARKLPLREPQLKTTRRSSPLAAKLGGGKLKLASSSRLTTEREGFGFLARVTQIRLSAGVATRLDKKLGLGRLLKGGERLGSARTEALPETVAIDSRGTLGIELAPGFAAKLASLFVAANPIFPAEHPGPFDFPIAGGVLAPDLSSGTLETSGAIELLQLGGAQVILHAPSPGLGSEAALLTEAEILPSPPYPGKLGIVPALALSGGVGAAEPAARTLDLSGATLSLTQTTADQLDEAFAKSQGKTGVFASGEELGTLSFGATGE